MKRTIATAESAAPGAISQSYRGYLLVLTAAILWGTLGIFSHVLTLRGVAPMEVAFWRALLGGVLFLADALLQKSRFPRGKDLFYTIIFGFSGVSLFYGAYQLAVDAGGASLASVLLYTAPAFVALLAPVILGEPRTPITFVLVALTIIGVSLVSLSGGTSVNVSPRSIAWGLTSGFAYALYYLFGKTVISRNATAAVLAIALPTGALGLLPFTNFVHKTSSEWALLAVIAVGCTYLPNRAYMFGLQYFAATRASVIASIEPVVAAVLAAIFLGERFAPLAIGGGATVLVAVVIAGRSAR